MINLSSLEKKKNKNKMKTRYIFVLNKYKQYRKSLKQVKFSNATKFNLQNNKIIVENIFIFCQLEK